MGAFRGMDLGPPSLSWLRVGDNGRSPFKELSRYFFVNFPGASITPLSCGLPQIPQNVKWSAAGSKVLKGLPLHQTCDRLILLSIHTCQLFLNLIQFVKTTFLQSHRSTSIPNGCPPDKPSSVCRKEPQDTEEIQYESSRNPQLWDPRECTQENNESTLSI
jgi:hypothetical protein